MEPVSPESYRSGTDFKDKGVLDMNAWYPEVFRCCSSEKADSGDGEPSEYRGHQ